MRAGSRGRPVIEIYMGMAECDSSIRGAAQLLAGFWYSKFCEGFWRGQAVHMH